MIHEQDLLSSILMPGAVVSSLPYLISVNDSTVFVVTVK